MTKSLRQNCDNIHVMVYGDRDQVSAMDMKLLTHAQNKKFTHLVVLEWAEC